MTEFSTRFDPPAAGGAGGPEPALVVPDDLAPPAQGPARTPLATYRRMVMIFDAAFASLAVALAVTIRFDGTPKGWYAVVPAVLPFLWVGLLALNRTYEDRFIGSGAEEFGRVLRSGLSLFTVIAVSSYSLVGNVSRSIVLFSVPAAVIGSLAARRLARRRLHRLRASGQGMQRTLVVGRGDAVLHLVGLLQKAPHQGLLPVGVCLPADSPYPTTVEDVPVVGTTDEVLGAVDRLGVNVVAIVSSPELAGHPLRRLSWALEERDVELLVSPGIVEVAGPRLSIRPVAGLSLLHLEAPATTTGWGLVKTVFDRLLAGAALLVLSPVLILVALAVLLTSKGPALFRQTRVGAQGREFPIYRFRSMVVDAEQRLVDRRERSEGDGMLFTRRADPRVTCVGGWLRRFSLDELPQLINVVKGDMALVGPRPPLPSEVAAYEADAARRLRVRPGITGLGQVSGRSDLTWEESLRLDLRYVDNWSMALDVSILWRTVRAVVKGDGAS